MLCRNPFTRGTHAYPCGRCGPCLDRRKRTWAHRIMLEAALTSDNAFVTLTYRDCSLPLVSFGKDVPPVGDLMPKHLQDFLKRLRKAIYPLKIRYYAVGEYGDETQRPHYHLALFRFPACANQKTQYGRDGNIRCCSQCHVLYDQWGHGNIVSGNLEIGSAQYVAGYVTKKMTHRHDPRLEGRHPEFARMSLRPGIGADFMHEAASTFLTFDLENTQPDVPSGLRHGTRTLPLGSYLRRHLRTLVGRDKKAPQSTIDEAQKEMLKVYEALRLATKTGEVSPKKIAVALGNQKVLQMETKSKIFKGKKQL